MVRLADLPDWDRRNKLEKVKELTGFDARPWVSDWPREQHPGAVKVPMRSTGCWKTPPPDNPWDV